MLDNRKNSQFSNKTGGESFICQTSPKEFWEAGLKVVRIQQINLFTPLAYKVYTCSGYIGFVFSEIIFVCLCVCL